MSPSSVNTSQIVDLSTDEIEMVDGGNPAVVIAVCIVAAFIYFYP